MPPQMKPGTTMMRNALKKYLVSDSKPPVIRLSEQQNLTSRFQNRRQLSTSSRGTSVFSLKKEGKYGFTKLDDYEVVKSIGIGPLLNAAAIGKGAYGEVVEAVHKRSGDAVALKIYAKSRMADKTRKANLLREVRNLEAINHPNVVKLYDCIDDVSKNVVMVMEFVRGVSLKRYASARRLSEKEVAHLFRQIVSAVAYCHSKGVAHRDLKLENVLVTGNGTVKIIDLGFSIWTQRGQKVKILCGTPAYMAPEIIKRYEYDPQLADIWAAGVVLYYLLSGTFPFKGGSPEEIGKSIAESKLAELDSNKVSSGAAELVRAMLTADPSHRFTAFAALQHPFLSGGKS